LRNATETTDVNEIPYTYICKIFEKYIITQVKSFDKETKKGSFISEFYALLTVNPGTALGKWPI